jgi:hypothetical protein
MQAIQTFTVRPVQESKGDSRLFADGDDVGRVEGLVLEGQYRCGPGFLVVTSDDSPFEEGLHFYLLDRSHGRLDDVSLGRMYHPGIYRDVVVAPDRDVLEFTFFGGDRWRLSVAAQPTRSWLPRPFSAVTRSRAWTTPRHLDLRRIDG